MPENKPLVTIGIPTYNRANKTLALAIESACRQDYPNLEIIVSDNCSTDNTRDVVGAFADPRLRYIRQEVNRGPNANYNACLHAARGAYFLLLHDDDLIDPDFVTTCMLAANYSTQYGFIRTGARIIDNDGKYTKDEPNLVYSSDPSEMYLAWVTWKTSFYLCATLFNTEALKLIGGFHSKHNLFEDGFAIIKLSEKHPILNIVESKASFRKHEQQRTHAAGALKWSEDFRLALDMIYLQNPLRHKEIYRVGMSLFSKVSIQFALKVKNPVKRMLTIIQIAKFFPYYYWPNTPQISLKSRIARTLAGIVYRDRKCLVGQP